MDPTSICWAQENRKYMGSTSLADIESQLLRICLEANHSLDSFPK